MDIKELLKKNAENDYKKFISSLIPNADNILGVRMPVLRKIAKQIYKNSEDFLKVSEFEYMEEIMLQAVLTGMLKKTPAQMIYYIRKFIPKINNWAICDCFCSSLKFTKCNLDVVWNFIQPYFFSDNEYEVRFACVMMLNYFVNDKYTDRILSLLDRFTNEGYYAEMAAAWLISVCFIKQREKTFEYLTNAKLKKQIFNKSIQKICESYRVNEKDKAVLKLMKK